MVGDNDWDLFAVVRSCNSAAAASSAVSSAAYQNATTIDTTAREDALSCLASLTFEDDDRNNAAFTFNAFQELHQAYMSFLPTSAAVSSTPDFPPSSSPGLNRHFLPEITPIRPPLNLRPTVEPPQHHHQPPPHMAPRPDFPASPMALSYTPKSRKRKNQQKRTICHVTAENLSTDMWAWRKYGQKPIKGSPYPRNYYRCSSSKGCAARKQVERSNSDPEIFIVTYTGDHTHPRPTHRNSLAGSSRNKLIPAKNTAAGDPDQSSSTAVVGSSSSPASPTTPVVSQNEEEGAKESSYGEKEEEMAAESDDDEEDVLIPNLAMRDEIFVRLEELGCSPKRRS